MSQPSSDVASPFDAVVYEKSDDKVVDHDQTCARLDGSGIGHGGCVIRSQRWFPCKLHTYYKLHTSTILLGRCACSCMCIAPCHTMYDYESPKNERQTNPTSWWNPCAPPFESGIAHRGRPTHPFVTPPYPNALFSAILCRRKVCAVV